MAYFLRFTETLELDMARQTSVHMCDGPDDADEFIEGLGWVEILPGLCAFPINAEDDEEAIEEAIESVIYHRAVNTPNAGGEEWGRHAYLFEGVYTGDCIDGDLFKPIRVIANITNLLLARI